MKILVIGPSWVGDMVMAQVLFRCLRQRHPDAVIDVLAPSWCRELLTRMPEVRFALPLPIAHRELGLGKRWHIGRELAQDVYDQAIVLPNSFKSALIPVFAKIPLRTGWRGEARGWLLNDCRRLDKTRYPLMAQRFAALAYDASVALPASLPRPQLKTDAGATAALRDRLHLDSDKPVLVLCPGAEFGAAKQWPTAHYAEVANHFAGQGMQVWLMGSERDAPVAQAILAANRSPDIINLCGRTTLGEAADLMVAASGVVSNDSGLMHVAAALARPLVVVYGSTSPAFTPPLADAVRTLSLGLDCSPCFKRECPLGHLNCLRQLLPDRVIDAALAVMPAVLPVSVQ
ncbi:MAG TPA: lipopolysaccharide heptosyltransferase II [Candidatus Acidoferrum sp.]|nr:lipopolysaccharide heptosyltransferase II [Candidatus Acidoferrum sp.]